MMHIVRRLDRDRLDATLLVGLVALAVRIVFLLAYGINAPVIEWGDDHVYNEIAVNLVEGGSYDNAWYPPGYGLLLAAIYATVGESVIVVRLVNALLGALTCALVHRIGTELYGPRTGVLAAALLAFYPGHVWMSWRLMAEVSFMFLIAAAVWITLRLSRHPTLLLGGLAGLLIGVAGAFKSNLLPFGPLLLLWLAWSFRRTPSGLRALAAAVLLFALATSLVPIFNYWATQGRTELLAGNAGHTFWWSNNPEADGYFVDPGDTPEIRALLASYDLEHILDEPSQIERDRLYRRLGLLWIRDHPVDFLALGFKKLNNAFGLFPRAAVFENNRTAQLVHVVSYGGLLPFIVGGMFLSLRSLLSGRGDLAIVPLYLLVLSYSGMVVLFYGTPRFTIIVMPALVVFAALALMKLVSLWRPRLASGEPLSPTSTPSTSRSADDVLNLSSQRVANQEALS